MSQELQLREVVFTCYKSVKVTHSIAIDRKLQACSLHIYSEIRTAKHANNVTTHNFQKLSFFMPRYTPSIICTDVTAETDNFTHSLSRMVNCLPVEDAQFSKNLL